MKLTVKIEQTLEGNSAEELFWSMANLLGTSLVEQLGIKGRDYQKNLAHLNKVQEGTLVITDKKD